MKRKVTIAMSFAVLIMLMVASSVGAQYDGYVWNSLYQVVNMGDAPADITVNYYDKDGVQQSAYQFFQDVPPGSSRIVVQIRDDDDLASGRYSAVISADQPVAAFTNLHLMPAGATEYTGENIKAPFASYNAESTGGTKVTLPAVMYNWYDYWSEFFIMNVGSGPANITIEYIPGVLAGQTTGKHDVTDSATIPQYASITRSQQSMSSLGAPSGSFSGRFLGSAVITSDQPIVAVANQHNTDQFKMLSYNGFTGEGSEKIVVPVHMRGYYGYYSTLLIANPSTDTTANVTITYTPDPTPGRNEVLSGSIAPVEVDHTIAPQTALTRYDGPPATDEQSDLDDDTVYTRFFGSVQVTSDIPVVVMSNEESVYGTSDNPGDGQAGSFNGIPVSTATPDIVVPVIMADYYGWYTTLVVQNTTGTAGTCDITYTSDGVNSARTNHEATYTHELPANGSFTVYEGRKGGQEIGDINSDPQWRTTSGQQFLGAATIHCKDSGDNGINVVAIVNEEQDLNQRDTLLTLNTFNK